MNRFKEQSAIVIGGAQGIGAEVARELAREGAAVTIADISDAGEALAQEIGGDFVHTDATAAASVEAAVKSVRDKQGRLHLAANLTGNIGPDDRSQADLLASDPAGWRQTVDLCATSAYLAMKAQIAAMLADGGGAIVNTASLAALSVNANASPAYHMAKAGVIHLSRMAAVEYGGRGIRVNVVSPGITATPRIVAKWDEPDRKRMAAAQPIGRMVTVEEVAAAYIWLLSPEASGVNGVTVPVDGGAAAR